MILTKRAREVLRMLVEEKDDDGEDLDILGERGRWYVGLEPTSWAVVKQLLQCCLIHPIDDHSGLGAKIQVYIARKEEAVKVLADPEYVPEMIRLIREGDIG